MPFGDYHNVVGAGWSVFWRIPKFNASGLEIWWADFQGRRVMWRGSAPFAIVPYHHPDTGGEPPGPHFCYKDGIDTKWGGAPFRTLKHTAPNSGDPWQNAAFNAADDIEAPVVTVTPGDDFNPATLTITAKFQCGWYQYVHSWEFDSYGAMHPKVAMGGMLNPFPMGMPTFKAHVHNFYFRLDLDIDGQYPHDVCEVFSHKSFNDPGGDEWSVVPKQMKFLADIGTARKWRVRSTTSKNPSGDFKAYEIELPQLAGAGKFSTGDAWVTVYRGDGVQQGEAVGSADASDSELETSYAVGPLSPATTGDDIVLWVVIRAHHEPRFRGEETNFLPYHYEEFSITPRSFAELRPRGGHGSG
ncbi:MAG: hypothetical protein ABJD07_11505 [Gemmatimonadaceae bacterium]